MAKEKLTLRVETLKLSEAALQKLKISGIDQLEDFNTFNIKELKQLLSDQFDEILSVLRKYHLPRQVENLSLSKESQEVLQHAGIHDLKEFLNFDRTTLYQLFSDDELLLEEINQLLVLYGVDPLKQVEKSLEADVVEEIEGQKDVSEIDIEKRIQKHVEPIRKGYGSRTFSHLKIRIASPDEIRQWSYGEVKKHETINYRTLKPERDGLFCEVIFGPTKDYQCSCGKSKRTTEKGEVCDKCGVQLTESKVRRERMGHIELAAPVVHTWFLRNSPSKIALMLDMKTKEVEDIVYLASYIVTDPGSVEELSKGQILTEQEVASFQRTYGYRKFTALTGAEAIKTLLSSLDLEEIVESLRNDLRTVTKQKREKAIKRLEVVEAFYTSKNQPEWMVMDVIPVLPPDLRPMVQLDGGRFATTDLNDLYRRILNRNNRLRKQFEQHAPALITKNEKRMLQEAVDALIDNSKRNKKVVMERKRPLKSLSDLLRGKQGRFRQNLLGKRVDYSGRSVIVVGPDLKMYQCGIPREMALILFKPFIINSLLKKYGENPANLGPKVSIKRAKEMIEEGHPDAMEELEKIVVEHPVLLNRAPTLHRLGIQAFEPKLVEGKAIRLHPLVTPAFNADFDGDQMAVHVPLSEEAQAEARLLMLASKNILAPKDGKPIVTPSQDMVLGNYYLTIEDEKDERNGRVFKDIHEVELAYENDQIGLHTRVVIPVKALNN